MARRLIGLDIGTNAVTLAEVAPGSPPRLERFGQVALPPDAMREGEVVDDRALIDAISRLRAEVDVKKTPVRLGLASPRAVVRQVEMPTMSRDELAGALKYQAADLIPIPMDEAVLDFAILGDAASADGESLMQVLLVAAHEAPTARLVSCVEAAGLQVAAVDLVPLALIRALAGTRHFDTDGEAGAEGIVSFGGGVTAIAVHDEGVPRFVRVLGSGGRELTNAIATELAMPVETAEALKRQIAQGGTDELLTRARGAIERPLAILLDEVRSSLDYYRNQPNGSRLQRVIITGGASQLPTLPERLATLVGLPVEYAAPRANLAIGDIRFPESEYPRLDPYLPAAVGLALGGAGVGTVVDLAPRGRKKTKDRSGPSIGDAMKPVLVGVAVLVGLLGIPTFLAKQAVADKKHDKVVAEQHNQELENTVASKADIEAKAGQVDALKAGLSSLLSTDVSWSHMLQDVSKRMPRGVYLSSFQGQVDPPAAAPAVAAPPSTTDGSTDASTTTPAPVPAAPAGLTGSLTIAGKGGSYADISAWLKAFDDAKFPALTGVWVSNASLTTAPGLPDSVEFSSSATLTDGAHSSRLERLQGGAQ